MKILERKLGRLFVPTAPRSPDPLRKEREQAKALAKEHGIELEKFSARDGAGVNVWPAPGMTRADPWESDHYAEDWKEALHMVRTYAGLEDDPSEASMQDLTESDSGVVLLKENITVANTPVSERIADADARGSSWLAKANDFADRGKKQQAEHAYQKGQFWLDRSNRLRGEN